MIQGEPSFSMPSAEELQAKIAEWEPKLVGKYIKQDSVDVDLSSVDPSNIVKVSDLPQPVRVIRPGTLDLLEYPRFQMKVLNELIPESQLPGMVTDLRQKASALVLQAKQKKEQQNPDGSEDNKTNGKHHANDTQVIHDPVVVRAGKKYKFLCRVPRIEHRLAATTSMTEDSGAAKPKEHDKNKTNDSKEKNSEERGAVDDPRNNERQAIQRGLELLSPLKSNCISYAVDWWTYEYCHGQFVRQYHKFEASENREAVVIQFKLGDHSKRKRLLTLPSGTNGHRRHGTTNNEVGSNAEDDEDANEAFRTTQIKRVGRKQFLAQTWAGGTVCDVTRKPREVEIQFHCDPNNPERISQVKETAVCQYLMIINTPRLCVDPGFYDSAASTIYDIACQEVVSDKRYQSILAKNALPDNTANAGAGLSKAADD
ncbi:Protein OS-9, partial [Dipsacomyces acuminosporus]